MIYASIAAVVIALLAWDVARFRVKVSALTDSHTNRQMSLERLVDESLDRFRELFDSHEARYAAFDNRLGHVEAIACELEGKPPVDLSKHDAAVVNLARQLKELADHVDKEIKRVQSRDVGALSMGRNRLVG